LYFLDTGLLCFLLRIRSPQELYQHFARGAIFESFVISELYKNFVNRGEQPALYFWQDSGGHEIDILIDRGVDLIPVEVKSASTIAGDFFKGLQYWCGLSKQTDKPSVLVYGGNKCFRRSGVTVYSWSVL
jgi:predicted AAA+ superfamily ATPase